MSSFVSDFEISSQGAFQQRDLRFMKQRLLDSAHNYERGTHPAPAQGITSMIPESVAEYYNYYSHSIFGAHESGGGMCVMCCF